MSKVSDAAESNKVESVKDKEPEDSDDPLNDEFPYNLKEYLYKLDEFNTTDKKWGLKECEKDLRSCRKQKEQRRENCFCRTLCCYTKKRNDKKTEELRAEIQKVSETNQFKKYKD